MNFQSIKDWTIGNANLANVITLFGIKLCFTLLGVIIFFREKTGIIIALSAVILLTDYLDGVVARYFNSVTTFGAAIDRLRDKFFQLTMFSFFLLDPRVDPLLKGVIYPLIIIELLLLAVLFLGAKKNANVSAGIWGKAKMFVVSIGILACSGVIIAKDRGLAVPSYVVQILFIILLVSLYLAIMSFKKHVKKYRQS